MIHYFDKTMAYTACRKLTGGQMAVKHSGNLPDVTCQICLNRLTDYFLSLAPSEINQKLQNCDIDAALEFLGILGHVRAAEIAQKLKCI